MNFAPYGNVRAMIQEGQVRAIAVTSAKRMAALPDVPTMTEAGFPQVGFDPDIWQAIVAPVGTPQPIIDKLNKAVNDSLRMPEVREIFDKLTFDPMIDTSEGFAKFLALQAQKWPPVVKAANIRPQ
jgi:tripartite-type tricarboxylate transporter receptor subunit TctC